MYFSLSDIYSLDKRFRTQLINSLTGIKPVNLIGTVSMNGETNLSVVSSVVHLGAHPPLVGYIQRPRAVERHTYDNIIETGCYTINAVSETFVEKAHQTSARYERNCSEFNEVGLNTAYLKGFQAPYVREALIKIGLSLQEIIPIKSNDTELIVGRIEHIFLPDELIDDDGHVKMYDAPITGVVGLDSYVSTTKLVRLSYAKPNQPLTEL
jgi:flavin reductase (DIM6/NTAB) family NADH-FMN oxidoreductase RutF